MSRATWLLLAVLGLTPNVSAQPLPFLHGADVSFVDRLEEAGVVFRDDAGAADLFALLKRHGFNAVRLRLWHTPADGYSGLPRTLALAQRAEAAGLHLLLAIHYSDTWADPAQQAKPAAWQPLPFDALRDSVRTYTERVLTALVDQGTPPALVQLGNEITGGLLWDDGRVGGTFDTPQQWRSLADLLTAAQEGVTAAFPDPALRPLTLMHLDRGGDAAAIQWFFDHLRDEHVVFDAIGLSYYPWWHGDLVDLSAALALAATRYQKPVFLVETAYPWTLDWFDDTHNLIGQTDQLLLGFPASVEGQTAFLQAVATRVRETPEGYGQGVFYWAPEWIPARTFGSSWENLALFAPDGQALASLDAWTSPTTVATPPVRSTRLQVALYPQPFADKLTLRYRLPPAETGHFELFDVLGRVVLRRTLVAPATTQRLDVPHLPSGLYFYRLTAQGGTYQRGALIRRR